MKQKICSVLLLLFALGAVAGCEGPPNTWVTPCVFAPSITEVAPGEYAVELTYDQETYFDSICLYARESELALSLIQVNNTGVSIIGAASGSQTVCLTPDDGAFDDLHFYAGVTYRIKAFSDGAKPSLLITLPSYGVLRLTQYQKEPYKKPAAVAVVPFSTVPALL